VVSLILAFICIKAPAIARRIGPTQKALVVISCLNSCGWVPIIVLLAFLMPKYTLVWLGLLWLINVAPSVLIEIIRDSWLANLIPSDSVGRYLGKRMAITSVFYLGTFLITGYMLDNSGLQLETSFAAIFTVAFVASLASFFIYSRMHDLPQANENRVGAKLGFSSFMTELKDKKLNRFMLFVSLFRFTVNFCGPLYAVYMLNDLHFSYSIYALVLCSEYLARIASVRLWGHLADRVGNIKVMTSVSRLIPILPVLWLFSTNAVYLMMVQALSGVCWAAFDLCNQGYIYKVAPASKKMLYVVYSRSIGLMCVALGGLFGVYLLRTIPPLGGNQISSIFLLSGVFRLAVAALLAHQLIDYALPLNESKVDRNIDIAAALARIARKVGLYYHPEKWGELVRVPIAAEVEGIGSSPEAAVSNVGLYHHPEDWQELTSDSSPSEAKAANTGIRASTRLAACQPSLEKEPELTPATQANSASASVRAIARLAACQPSLEKEPELTPATEVNPASASVRATARLAACQPSLEKEPELTPATQANHASASARAATRRAVYQLSPEEWREIVGIAPSPAVSAAAKATAEANTAFIKARATSRLAHCQLTLKKHRELVASTTSTQANMDTARAGASTVKPTLRNRRPIKLPEPKEIAGLVASPIALAAKARARVATSKNNLRNLRPQKPAGAKGLKLQPALAFATVSS
jgi:hypothetical protein